MSFQFSEVLTHIPGLLCCNTLSSHPRTHPPLAERVLFPSLGMLVKCFPPRSLPRSPQSSCPVMLQNSLCCFLLPIYSWFSLSKSLPVPGDRDCYVIIFLYSVYFVYISPVPVPLNDWISQKLSFWGDIFYVCIYLCRGEIMYHCRHRVHRTGSRNQFSFSIMSVLNMQFWSSGLGGTFL